MEKTVSGIYIYPVKSCRGIGLNSAKLNERGLEYDRQWMVVDNDGNFLSQREHPKMALIRVSLEEELLVLSAPGVSRFDMSLHCGGDKVEVVVHKKKRPAISQDKRAGWWLTFFLGIKCHLVRVSRESFADIYPYLVISQASLDDLNKRIKDTGEQMPMDRFRPNIVVCGYNPYEEDNWERIKIGEASIQGEILCRRCTIPRVDQEIGEMKSKEPIKTLSTYRSRPKPNKNGKVVVFGKYFSCLSRGEIQVGDKVKVITTV